MNAITFNRFLTITNIDIYQFFKDFVTFFNTDYQNIVDYFSNGGELLSTTLTNLENLTATAAQIRRVYNTNSQLTSYYDDFELLDYFETCCTKLDTVQNSQKWFRTNKGLTFDNKVETDYVLPQRQTLATLAQTVGYNNPNDDWANIALRNNIREDDYTEEGGVSLKIVFQNNNDYKLNSVLDSISGINIYGADISCVISYENNDLQVLGYIETRDQTFNTLLNLSKGSVPEFPNDGLDKSLLGGNINSLQYPVMIRQISETFAKDDLFKSVSMTNISRVQNQVRATITAKTRLGDFVGESNNLQLVQ